jgi:hypothetical protein
MTAATIFGVFRTDSANALAQKVHDTVDRGRGVAEGAPASAAVDDAQMETAGEAADHGGVASQSRRQGPDPDAQGAGRTGGDLRWTSG